MQYATEILIIKAMKKKHEGNYFPVLDQNQVNTTFIIWLLVFLHLCFQRFVRLQMLPFTLPLSLLVSLHVYTRQAFFSLNSLTAFTKSNTNVLGRVIVRTFPTNIPNPLLLPLNQLRINQLLWDFSPADIKECFQTLSPCHQNANCTELSGTFNCSCSEGFEGNGTYCEGWF